METKHLTRNLMLNPPWVRPLTWLIIIIIIIFLFSLYTFSLVYSIEKSFLFKASKPSSSTSLDSFALAPGSLFNDYHLRRSELRSSPTPDLPFGVKSVLPSPLQGIKWYINWESQQQEILGNEGCSVKIPFLPTNTISSTNYGYGSKKCTIRNEYSKP